jgi:hypothetical protein
MQDSWRRCAACHTLVFVGFGNGHCATGGEHDVGGSPGYLVAMGETPSGTQPGWRWCARCQMLVFVEHGNGVCWNTEPHDPNNGSGAYAVPLDGTPAGAESGWSWCSLCHGLVFGGGGLCTDAEHHDLTSSGSYSVHQEERPLTLLVEEQGRRIFVTGGLFSANGPVALAYNWAGGQRVEQLTADGGGAIEDVQRDTVPGSCTVTARDEWTGRFTFGRAEGFRPRLSNDPVVIDHGTALEPG